MNPFFYDFILIQFNMVYVADEDLIKWGWPEDVWFHVDKVSSAHVYLRLQPVKFVKFNTQINHYNYLNLNLF